MKKLIKPLIYILSLMFVFGCIARYNQNFKGFVDGIENKTFDLRQNIVSKDKNSNKDIVILAVDNASYEYFTNKYGAWPPARAYWGDLIDKIEKYSPKLIAFDLLFVSRFTNEKNSDEKLINAVNSNRNVFVGLDFDNYEKEVRTPPEFPNDLKSKIINPALLEKSPYLTFTNSRGILKEILNGTKNIGAVNTTRDEDGTIRNWMPFIIYKGEFYRQLSLVAGMKALNLENNEFTIKNNVITLDKNHVLPLDSTGRVILNWYGPAQTFKHVPLYKLEEAFKNNDTAFLNETLKDKIIYIGTTATALFDMKTSPTAQNIAGVEIHTTFVNNLIDNNFIKRTSPKVDVSISLLLVLLVGLIVFKNNSTLLANIEVITLFVLYFICSVLLMNYLNVWVGLVIPFAGGILAFIAAYILKYLFKSKDYEQTYKLAVTDALTDMFNHRYFQEQMILNCQNAARYETPFSLILIDIDFFKKFNDTHGHQSGDAVLKQVAQTIKKAIRSTDVACRYGGEEMAVILTNTTKNDAVITAEKICAAVREKEFLLANGQKTNVTISLGVAAAPVDGKTPVDLIEFADKCLYRAKANGRNQVIYTL